jgi:hypothetical protein
MVVAARGHKVKQQSWTVRVVYGMGEISKKKKGGENDKEVKQRTEKVIE